MSTNGPTTESLHVSLAGLEEARVESALDVALQRLTELSGQASPGGHDQGQGERTVNFLVKVIDAISGADCRTAAAEKLVAVLASEAPDVAIRCAIGSHNLKRFYDHKLGWLGNESELFTQAADQWSEHDRPPQHIDIIEPDSDPNTEQREAPVARVLRAGGKIELHLPQPSGGGRFVVWIGQTDPSLQMSRVLTPLVGTIASVFWNRPARSWPAAFAGLGRRSKIVATAALVICAVAAIWPTHYRVACQARVDTISQRLISAPFEASLLATNVRPGDSVQEGDVLVELDGRPLRLERESLLAELQQASKEHDVALATRRIADAQQSKLKCVQFERKLELIDDRLNRLEVVSPISGVVVSGDLERYVGSSLQLGQTLMEVAPLDSMVIEVEVPEHEIGFVRDDSDARVRVAAIGGRSIRMRLDELFPAAEIRDDKNVFIGQIKVDNRDLQLKPGMRGEATVYGPLRPWIWSWVRSGVERGLWWIGY